MNNVNNLENDKTSKIVSFENWKQNKREQEESATYAQYLELLDYNSLLIEVQFLVGNLQAGNGNQENIRRGKMIIDEISKRIQFTAPGMAKSIQEAQSNLTASLNDLEKSAGLDH